MALARLCGVKKRYGAQPVLNGVSLTVEPGELLALVGRSGSGKSTLLHILGGLDRRCEGQIEVLGIDPRVLDDRALSQFRNREVGFVFQSFNLLEHWSVLENVMLPSWFGGPSPPRDARRQALEALGRVGVASLAARRPGELSGGQKQRVAIARALFCGPKLLLADEPTGNLDAQTGAEIIELFSDLVTSGLTLVLVTHEERVSKVASRILRIDDGRIEGLQ